MWPFSKALFWHMTALCPIVKHSIPYACGDVWFSNYIHLYQMTFNIDIFDLFPINLLSTYSPYLDLFLKKIQAFVSIVKQGWHGMTWHVNENFQSTSSSCWYHFKAIFEHVPILPYNHAWAQVASYLSQTFKIETNFVWYGYVQMCLKSIPFAQ